MGPVIQIIGALLVLAGFALAQWGVLDGKSVRYLLLNLVGSGVLAVDAWFERQWGFLLLEAVWAVVSAISLARVLSERRATGTPDGPKDEGAPPMTGRALSCRVAGVGFEPT